MFMLCTLGYARRNKNTNINCLANDIKHSIVCLVETMVVASFRSRLQHPDLKRRLSAGNHPCQNAATTARGSVTTHIRFISANYTAEDASLRHLIVTVFISSPRSFDEGYCELTHNNRTRLSLVTLMGPILASALKNVSSKTRVFPPNLRDW